MSDKGGLQLLPETRKSIVINVPGEYKLIRFAIVVIVIVLILYGALWWYGSRVNAQLTDINNQLQAQEQQRNKGSEAALLTLGKQMNITSQVVKDHVHWSVGFDKIEQALQRNVQFKSFAATTNDGVIHITFFTDNYSTLARQLASFVADNAIKDISLDTVTVLTDGRLDVNAQIKFDTSKFLSK